MTSKESGCNMKFAKVHSALLIAALLLGGVIFSSVLQPVSAQTVQPTATPIAVSTPVDPAVSALQSTVATQQVQIDQLQRDLAQETRNREFDVRDLVWKWGIAAAIATAVIGILTWIGKYSLSDLQNKWQRESQRTLDQAIFKMDPSNLPIYLPSGEKLEELHNVLQKRRFGKVSFYDKLSEFTVIDCQGVIIISLKDKNDSEQKTILGNLKDFIQQQKPVSSKTGFIIFAPGDITVPKDVTGSYDNLVTANYPATVVNMVFAVGRGLDIVPNK